MRKRNTIVTDKSCIMSRSNIAGDDSSVVSKGRSFQQVMAVWTLKYWNKGLFFSECFEEFPVCFGIGSISVPKELHLSYPDFLCNTIPCNLILGEFGNATCSLECFEQSVSSPDRFKEGIR